MKHLTHKIKAPSKAFNATFAELAKRKADSKKILRSKAVAIVKTPVTT